MTAQRWKQVRDLFDAALEQPAGERDHFVAAQAAGDLDLVREVGDLLASYEDSDHLITQPAIKGLEALLGVREPAGDPASSTTTTTTTRIRAIPPTNPAGPPGLQFGYYRVVGKLGPEGVAGAPSVLLLATDVRQSSEEQRLAIRVFRAGLTASRILPRFQRERPVLTGLAHPHIARLLDAGASTEGLPFLVMEHVEGQPIVDYCRERQLKAPARLTLFNQICGAVRFAHRSLVVHGNLDTSKILVTSGGALKIVEFGVAGLTASQTEPPAADLLALGSVLRSLFEDCRAGLDPQLAAKLAAIEAKLLAEDPATRYPSAEELSQDVALCLAGPTPPPTATPPAPALPRPRPPSAVVISIVAAILLAAISAASLFYVIRARQDVRNLAAQTVVRLSGLPSPTPETLDVLAQAYYALGDRAKAVETERRALALLPLPAPGEQPSALRRQLEQNLAKFIR